MPVLIIHGVSEEADKLEEYTDSLANEISSVEALNLKAHDVSCFYPKDLMARGLGEEIIIFVEGLLDRPERTEEVRNQLAEAVVKVTHWYFPDANLIECFVRPFDIKLGFCNLSN